MTLIKVEEKRDVHVYKVYMVCLLITAAAFFASLCIGKYPLSLNQIAQMIMGGETDELAKKVFFTLRVPRSLMALLAGVSLSVAGSVYQGIFKNPLAAPDLIGASSGAGAGAAFSIVCLHSSAAGAALWAFLGGTLAVGFSVVLTGITRQRRAADFVIAGIAVKALADAFVMLMKYMADPEKQLASIDYWLMGSFSGTTAEKLLVAAPLVLISLLGLFLLRWKISLLMLSDDEAMMLGLRVHAVRITVLALTTLLVASVVSVTGSIAFIGLIAPHIAALLLKQSCFASAAVSGLIGGFILLMADMFARGLSGGEIPVSIFTSAFGVPVLIYLLYRKGC